MERFVIILGGIEIIAGGAMTAFPQVVPATVGYLVILVGVITVGYGIWGMKPKGSYFGTWLPKRWLWNWRVRVSFNFDSTWPVSRLIPFSQAAQWAYEQTLGTVAALQAEQQPGGDVRGWYLVALDDNGNTPLYGVRSSSNALWHISPDNVRKAEYINGGQTIKDRDSDRILYEKVYIKQSDLKKRVKEIREWDSGTR